MSPYQVRLVTQLARSLCVAAGVVLLFYFALDAVGWDRPAYALVIGTAFLVLGGTSYHEINSLERRVRELENRWRDVGPEARRGNGEP